MISSSGGINWFIGTMGFSFQDWIGNFYPKGLRQDRFLSYYSRFFNSVEIDSTFYGTPNRSKVLRWKTITPMDFKISVKMPRSITHDAGLRNVKYETKEFVERVKELGEKLGVVLIQMPPFFGVEQIGPTTEFLKSLPDGIRYAIEMRDKSWFEIEGNKKSPIFVNILRENDICWAATEYPNVPNEINPTTDFLYIRWIGKHGTFQNFTKASINRQVVLKNWVERMNDKKTGINTIYGYFNNDYSGFSPETANEFKKIVGLEITDFKFPVQSEMF
jgi:uncharacterized protein YecE (DUF72 family)